MNASEQNLQPDTAVISDNQAPLGERLAAANRETLAEAEASAEPLDEPLEASGEEPEIDEPLAEEVIEEEDQPEVEDEGDLGEEAEEPEDDPIPQESKPWDGNRESVPEEHLAYFDQMAGDMKKGMNAKFRELADEKRKVEALALEYQHAMLEAKRQAQEPQVPNGPPKPPEAGASEADWQRYEQAMIEFKTEPLRAELNEMKQAQAVSQQKMELQERLTLLTTQPGVTDAILQRMHDMAEADPSLVNMYYADDTAIQFFNQAKFSIEKEGLEAERAELAQLKAKAAKAEATRKAGAANRVSSRPGSTTAPASPQETFAKQTFNSTEDKLKHLNAEILRESRSS